MLSPLNIFSIETWVFLASAVTLIWYYFHRKWQYLKNLNIPHDPPSILKLGNILDVMHKTKTFEYDIEQKKKHGLIWGTYSFTTPVISVHDPDILRQIYTKEFHTFPTRQRNLTKINGKELNTAMTVARGEQWKRIRNTMTPTFSSAKLKQMTSIMEWCVDNAIEALNRKLNTKNGIFKAKEIFSRLSLDIVCSSAFSTKVNSQDDTEKEPEMSKQAKKLFTGSIFRPAILLCLLFPSFERIAAKMNVTLLSKEALDYFKSVTTLVIKRREDNPHGKGQRVDLMQLMLDSKISEEDSKKGVERGMTMTEIIGNSMVMILGGYENTGNTMVYLAYSLAHYPDIQKEIQKEVDEMMKTHGKFDYDGVKSLKLLEMCINETLRLYTPILRNVRICEKDITINGLTIPKGISVAIPTYGLSHDPEHWDDPFEFKPERFEDMTEIDPMIYQPFGAGPRNCVGLRFALLEIKLAFAKLLHKFTIEPTETTPKPPLQLTFSISVRPAEDFDLRVVRRKEEEAIKN